MILGVCLQLGGRTYTRALAARMLALPTREAGFEALVKRSRRQ